ncbi:MAG: ABC transporter permease [Deltaproteobacteria bacterium]|nr:ABC transporter permease [Deltaproteobacteria bacterium]
MILCGYSFRFEIDYLPIAIYDSDHTKFSREMITKFTSTEYFKLDRYISSYDELKNMLDNGSIKTAIVIPAGFSRRLMAGEPAKIQYICDAGDANMAGQGVGYAKMVMADYNKNVLIERLNKRGIAVKDLPGIDSRMRTFYSQEMDSIYFVVVLHIVVAGLIAGLVLSSVAIVREKERGTIDQLMVTPATAFEFILAKAIAPLVVGLIATVFSFLTVVWFGVPLKGNVITFFIYMAFFLIGNIGTGILIGSICQNMLQAILLSYLTWFPGIALTGIIMPVENMIPFVQVLGKAMPTYHFLNASNAIFQKGVGFAVLWPEALFLLGIGLALFMAGYFIMLRQWKS